MEIGRSKLFLIFCLAFIAGISVGSKITVSTNLLAYLFVIWLAVFVSGQKSAIHTLSLAISAILAGWLIWQLTGGESWLHLSILGALANSLTNFRNYLTDRIMLALTYPHNSLLSGILFGNRQPLSPELMATFKKVGLTHIVAVSGYNLTIIIQNMETALSSYGKKWSIYISFAFIGFFVLLTGAPGSIIRAAAMSAALLTAQLFGRPAKILNIMILAAAIIIIFQPKMLFDIGFELSLAATYGLIRLSPYLKIILKKIYLPEAIAKIISETLAATLVTLPVIMYYFGRLSVMTLVANLLVLPLVPLMMALGIVGVVASLIYIKLGYYILLSAWPILEWMIVISNKLASLKYSVLQVDLPTYTYTIVIIIMIIAVEFLNAKIKINEITKKTPTF